MKLEVGKYYRTAEGEKVGPMLAWSGCENEYHFDGDEDGRLWWGDGTRRYGDSDGVIVAEWVRPGGKFKVGDRVRVRNSATPEVGVLVYQMPDTDWLVFFEGWGKGHNGGLSGLSLTGYNHYWVGEQNIEPAPVLTIQAGKFYKTRDGRKVGPMDEWREGAFREAEFDGRFWNPDGTGECGARDEDLIAEWVDEPVAVAESAGGGFSAGDKIRLVQSPVEGYRDIGEVFMAAARTKGVSSSVHYIGRDGKVTWAPGSYFELVNEAVATPAIPTIGDWVKDSDGRIGIVFYDDGDDWDNLYVGWTDYGDWETVGAKYLTIVPPGTKRVRPEPAPEPANDNYEVGDIVEIVETRIFNSHVNVGDIAAVTDTDGEISIRVQTKDGPVDQVVFFEHASHIRPYRRAA